MEKEQEIYNIIFHVGLPKTGTTFLQKGVFPRIKNINFIDGSHTHNKKIRRLLEEICKCEKSADVLRRELLPFLYRDRINLISFESLFGDVYSKDISVSNPYRIADNLYLMFPDAKIIFVMRELDGLMISLYGQYVKQGGIKDFSGFVNDVINIERFNFERYTHYLKDIFGEENVYICKFEDLKENAYEFVSGICDFIGVKTPEFKNKKHNIAYGKRQIEVALTLNKFFRTRFNPSGKIPWITRFPVFFPPRLLLENRFSQWLHYEKFKPDDVDLILAQKFSSSKKW